FRSHHGPPKQIGARNRYNFITHTVMISIRLNTYVFKNLVIKLSMKDESDIVLIGIFWTQEGISNECVIKIVESRHPEYGFVKCSQTKIRKPKGLPTKHHGGCQLMLVFGRLIFLDLIIDVTSQQTSLKIQATQSKISCQSRYQGVPPRIWETI